MSDSPERKAARSILQVLKKQYGSPSVLLPVSAADFSHLDLDAYEVFRQEMEAREFHRLGDLEMKGLSDLPNSLVARTMIRCMVSSDEFIVSDYYQLKPRVFMHFKLLVLGLLNLRFLDAPRSFFNGIKACHYYEFETEFSDGSFLATSNAQSASLVSGPSIIESNFFPYETPPAELLRFHCSRIEGIARENPDLVPVGVSSLPKFLQMQQRLSMLKAAHRASIQWISKAELEGMAGRNSFTADAIYAELQYLLRNDQPHV